MAAAQAVRARIQNVIKALRKDLDRANEEHALTVTALNQQIADAQAALNALDAAGVALVEALAKAGVIREKD